MNKDEKVIFTVDHYKKVDVFLCGLFDNPGDRALLASTYVGMVLGMLARQKSISKARAQSHISECIRMMETTFRRAVKDPPQGNPSEN